MLHTEAFLQKTKLDFFSAEFAPQYLIFKVSFTKFPVKLSMGGNFSHNNEQFGGCLLKIKQILSI